MQVFLFQSSLFAQVTSAHPAVLLLPNVKGRFRDPHFPADFFDLYSRLSLLKGKQDLCFGELRLFLGYFLLFKLSKIARFLYFIPARFFGGDQLNSQIAN
jgi:hypothetical protein